MNTSCGKEWTRKQIATAFTKTFINGKWKQNREKVLFDRQLALLPATQHLVEEQVRQEHMNLYRKQFRELKIFMRATHIERQTMTLSIYYPLLKDTKEETDNALWIRYGQLHDIIVSALHEKKPIQKERNVFVRACPDENCRGFLSTQWKCGICEQYSCPECHIVKGKTRDCDHTCNPDDVATAKLLAKDTKPCPNCGTGIFKICGCDQMWCTQCRTAFSWKTGTVETNIHNPHYYEWMRRNNNGVVPRNPGDNGRCDVELRHTTVSEIDRIIMPISRTEYASYPNKSQTGFSTTFWFDRLISPTVTLWPAPDGASAQVLKYYRVTQIEDSNFSGGQTVDIPYLWLEAFADGLAYRLAKVWNPQLAPALKAVADETYGVASRQNIESAQQYISPQVIGYYRP
jgi:hypothetical protein